MTLKKLQWENNLDLKAVLKHLKHNEVLVGASDTVLGLLAQANEETFKKLQQIKGRQEKPFLLLIDSPKSVEKLSDRKDAVVERLINACWPGPLTLILPLKPGVPAYLGGGKPTVAVRMPDHKGLQFLLKEISFLFSTSANLSGMPVAQHLNNVSSSILNSCVAAITDNDEGATLSSTILDCSNDTISLVREGAYPVEKLEEIIGYSLKEN